MAIKRIGPDANKDEAARIRAIRNRRLAECDCCGLADVRASMNAEDVAAWDVYRQALRDLPGQAGFPDAVQWPVKPE